ncbi:N-acetylmuramoyl-L-alanine amidase family protein [Clostridium sp. Marseille-P2415]|uniref:N-acetylmuramoyl-L-alanine amidase family protein n=1 Tax=Clostridium sp. Marseille-P2415 TaxID=1805471 RepID=UPI0009885EAA|nr:N-acetylmuramoyl-L-alanine amidase [Clostridium sp. Marseille-P2415]
MIQIKNFLPAAKKALLLAALISTASVFAAQAEEESGPAFAPPVTKTVTPEIGPGIRNNNFIVVLDPGHGKTDGHYSGCSFEYNGVTYYEDEITMKIANYTKQYLEQNSNYTVYLTKDSAETTVALEQRAAFAASVHADLFVSQHVDSALGNGTVKNAYGVSSMAPRTGRYNSDLAVQSQEAANTILNQLNALGLHNRGLLLRDSQNGTLYPDGSQADYYAIPRYSQMYGIRGFIIEHGFLNHPSDLTLFLSTEEQYKALGEADAKGIMEYLKKAGKAPQPQTPQNSETNAG